MVNRIDLIERIEAALVDWKPFAQPHELSGLAELLLDAKDAADAAELGRLDAQFRGLESFVASRKASSVGFLAPDLPKKK